MKDPLILDPAATALVLIDLQKGILATPTKPHPAEAVVAGALALARAFRAAGSVVVLVRVGWSDDLADLPPQPVDLPTLPRRPGTLPADWLDFADGLTPHKGDILIVKRHWGAFIGTELDLQLRRRSISTIVLGGVATNFGVESTARSGWELGYSIVVAEDLCAGRETAAHEFAIETILPRIARVSDSGSIAKALGQS